MEKLQRRLRLFIVLALLTGAAAALFVGTAHAQTSTAPQVTLADMGLQAAPPLGGLAAWWDSFRDGVKLQFTFNPERKAELQLQRAAKLLAKLASAEGESQATALLEKYRAAVNGVAAKAQLSDAFLQRLLAHQGFLTQVQNAGKFDSLAQQLEVARNQNWEKLNVTLGDPRALVERLAALPTDSPEAVARRAALLEEWRQRLSPEQQEQTKSAIDGLIERLRSLSPAEAAALAEHLGSFSSMQQVQVRIGSLLEGVQPSLAGLGQQLATPRRANQDPTPSVAPGSLGNVTVPPLSAAEISQRRAELADAVTKDELLALRQRWYGNAVLYRQLAQYQRNLLDQLNAKLVKALGTSSTPVVPSPVSDPDAGVTPLPTQQLTPEQQAMGQVFINMQGINPSDLPPPAVSF